MEKSKKGFKFKCSSCDEIHEGIPSLSFKAPIEYYSIPKDDLEKRCELTSDACIIDNEKFFIKGCLEIPVHGYDDYLSLSCWVELQDEESFLKYLDLYEINEREDNLPLLGWLDSWVYPLYNYDDETDIKAKAHFRNGGVRPYIELEPTNHPIALAQQDGISEKQLIQIYEHYLH